MSDLSNLLQEEYTVDTPESVAFGYEVAGIGSRFIATLIDSLIIIFGFLVVLALYLGLLFSLGRSLFDRSGDMGWEQGLLLAILILIQFVLFWGYYIAFELIWNGQTPGKHVAGVRVIRVDGQPAGATEVIVRNLVRIIDFLPSGYGIGFVAMFFSRQSRRLGDYAAGTLVIKVRSDVSLATLTPAAGPTLTDSERERAEALASLLPNLRALTIADTDLITTTLSRQHGLTPGLIDRLAAAIAAKIGCPPPLDARRFLEDVLLLQRHQRT